MTGYPQVGIINEMMDRWFFNDPSFNWRIKGKKWGKGFAMSSKAKALRLIVRKTIAGVVIRESVGAGPRDRLFIVFTDNTYLEFFGNLGWTDRLEVGDLETVKQYASQFGGNIEVIF